MIFAMLPDFLMPASAGAANISVLINGADDRWGDNLSAAIGGIGLDTITSIEVTDGGVTTADWNYMKSKHMDFSALTEFTVAGAVYPVADIPDVYYNPPTSPEPIFPYPIERVIIPKVATIGEYAFVLRENLTEINLANVTTVREGAFLGCNVLSDMEIPEAATIGNRAFYNCNNLTDVELPEVTEIGAEAFLNCDNLTDIEIPKATSLGNKAFAYCMELTEINIPKATTLGAEAFLDCYNLADVELPKVTEIGAGAFWACFNLTALKVPGTPPAVGSDAFVGCPQCRNLVFVDANGDELTGDGLDNARAAYKAAEDGDTGDNLWYGWNIIPDVFLDIDDGDIDINGGSVSGNKITQGTLIYDNYDSNGMITITGTSDTNKIVVDGVDANVTLDNVSIDVSASEDVCAFELKNGANADLALSGDNSLTSGTNRAGLEVATGQSITIDGNDTDSLTATSKSGFLGAAGIGGGSGFASSCGTINIIGGNITATGGNWSAGIGGGKSGLGGTVNISGGIITATGGGSGIGGGTYAEGGTINISGGNVTATGGASGIGGGYNNGSESNPACDAAITIMEAATVKASGAYKGEAISATGGTLESGSTARILTANFSENQSSSTKTEVFNEVYGNTPVSSITPAEDYLSAAFTLPEGTYNLKAAGNLQQYTNIGEPTGIDFVIPDAAGIYIFEEVEDAPVLTSVSISGTVQVGQTLTAAVSPAGATASYQWKADSTDITGATGSTYAPAAADVDKTITVTATATGEWFGTVTSSPIGPVLAAPANNNGGKKDNVRDRKPATGLPYYMKDGKKVFIGFSATGEYIVPEGVTVLFGENPKGFTDIENHWAKSSIDFVTEREIFQGMDENNFGPEISMTRGMFVTVIGRLYERSYGNITGNTVFSDVDPGAYYSGYVAWAHENGIIEGIGGDMFDPEREISHEQMAAIMFRFAKFLGKGPQGNWMINVTYPDSADISDWAMESAAYCQLTGIITGGDGGKFAPKAVSTRAEVATVIERFINEMLK